MLFSGAKEPIFSIHFTYVWTLIKWVLATHFSSIAITNPLCVAALASYLATHLLGFLPSFRFFPLVATFCAPLSFPPRLVARFALRLVVTTDMPHDPAISSSLETYTHVSNHMNKRISAKFDSLCLDYIGMHAYKFRKSDIIPFQSTSCSQFAWDQRVLIPSDTHCDSMHNNLHLIYAC